MVTIDTDSIEITGDLGNFKPSNPGSNYPILTATNHEKQITTVYENVVISFE